MNKNKYNNPFSKSINKSTEIIGQKEFDKRNIERVAELNKQELERELEKEIQEYTSKDEKSKEYKVTKKGRLTKDRIAAIMIAIYMAVFMTYVFKQTKSKPINTTPPINTEQVTNNDPFEGRVSPFPTEVENINYQKLAKLYLYDNIRIGDFQYISHDTDRYESSESVKPNSKTSNIQLIDKIAIIDQNGKIMKIFDTTSTGMSISQMLKNNNIEYKDEYKIMIHVVNPADISSERGWIEAIPENFIEVLPDAEVLSEEYGAESSKGVGR